jgi:SnoaL-like domain
VSSEISLGEIQEFFGEFWYHYDSGHYDELAVRFAEDANYISRSESGASPFEEVLAANLTGRDEIVGWLTEHREGSPYPLRHNSTNIHRTGTDGGVTHARSYIFVTQVANHVPFAVSSGVLETGIKRDPKGLVFTTFDLIMDTDNSIPFAEFRAAANAVAN